MTNRTNVLIYTFESGDAVHAIRVLMRDDAPWFVAADICRALDLINTTDALGRLDEDEKGLDSIYTLGGQQEVRVVSEHGLYSLVLGSRKPEAKPFKRWITHEVLPSIARTGVYVDASNRMGETLGAATDNALGIEGKSHAALTGSVLISMLEAMRKLSERLDRAEEAAAERDAARDAAYLKAFERLQQENGHQLRSMRQELSRNVGKAVRIAKAQRASNKNLDPNRPLSEDDVERFKYLMGTGATAKQIARSLNRTYEVIRRFMDTNQDLVIRTLQHSLL